MDPIKTPEIGERRLVVGFASANVASAESGSGAGINARRFRSNPQTNLRLQNTELNVALETKVSVNLQAGLGQNNSHSISEAGVLVFPADGGESPPHANPPVACTPAMGLFAGVSLLSQ